MKKYLKSIALLLASASLVGCLAGCAGDTGNGTTGSAGANNTNPSGGPTNENAKVTISLLVEKDFIDEWSAIAPAFYEKYPEINVKVVYGSGWFSDTPTDLTTFAASNELPDVAIGVENFGYIVSQGLAYPLDKLYAADADKQYALEKGVENYTYSNHIFALPFRVQFNTILVNTGLFDELNLDAPEYDYSSEDFDWTIEKFMELCRKATTDSTNGINIVENDDLTHALATKLMGGLLDDPYQMYCYNMDTREFDFTGGAWTKAYALINELRAAKAIADELKESGAYDQKFGENADALRQGKVLFGNHNSWETKWMYDFAFEWDMYPTPVAEGHTQRIQSHMDYVFMTSAVTEEKREAAYALVKFLSYDREGCLARLAFNEKIVKGETTYQMPYYTPASGHPDVIAAYSESEYTKPGLAYMLKTITSNPEQCFVADLNKLIPNFWNDVIYYKEQVDAKLEAGGDANALAQDFQNKVNNVSKETWKSFEKKLDKFLNSFYESHPYEKT